MLLVFGITAFTGAPLVNVLVWGDAVSQRISTAFYHKMEALVFAQWVPTLFLKGQAAELGMEQELRGCSVKPTRLFAANAVAEMGMIGCAHLPDLHFHGNGNAPVLVMMSWVMLPLCVGIGMIALGILRGRAAVVNRVLSWKVGSGLKTLTAP